MKWRPRVPAAYAPAQGATATDAGGRPVVLLFVPHWNEVIGAVGRVAEADTQWAFSREVGLPLLFVRFQEGQELAMTFPPSGSLQLLSWWESRGRVDLVLAAAPLQDVELAALGFREPGATTPAYVRVRDVPFMTG